ncbi:hypothetical protein ACFWOL_08565 [Streptomyces sp. NPDC058442]|uniref:hypothetical protein n=1 Tax=Streptomyces sp. NPDC058442 TaxID=3346503 RepID=UPI003655C084
MVDTVKGSELPNLKEFRPGSAGATEVRLLFVFDPERQASSWSVATRRVTGPAGTAYRCRRRSRRTAIT